MKLTSKLLLAMANNAAASKADDIASLSPVAYIPFTDNGGTTVAAATIGGQNGVYSHTDVPGAATYADGSNAPLFVRADTNYCDVFNMVNTHFDRTKGHITADCQIDPSVWTDGIRQGLLNWEVNSSNRVRVWKSAVSNLLEMQIAAGGTSVSVNHSISTTDWFNIQFAWDTTGNFQRIYVNGVQVATGAMGTWSGSAWTAGRVVVGARYTTLEPSDSKIAHLALWDSEQTANVATLAAIPS